MNVPVMVLVLCAYVVIGVLPRIFFKGGSFNSGWWLTGAPFFCVPPFLIAADLAHWHSWVGMHNMVVTLDSIAAVLTGGSIALLFYTLGTHRVPLALWHQEDDAPVSIVTYGAYSRIRHPFYSSFLLAFLGSFALFPHLGTLLPMLYAIGRLTATAMREEKRLSTSEFGSEYREYISKTGRFLPI